MTTDIQSLVEEQVAAILARRGGVPFRAEQADMLDAVSSQVNALLQDRSMGRILNGPLWLSGTSVVDNTITANKLIVNTLEAVTASTGTLNVTGAITAAASFPAAAARIVINSSGLYGYQSDGVTTTFKLNVDGSGEIGTGASKMSWTNTGVLSVPVAAIGALTIGNIGTGVLGGTYTTSASTAKLSLSSAGLTATDGSGNTTFQLVAATGAVTATGLFTIKSAASGARVEISNAGGIEGFNASNVSTFLLNAATGAGRLGTATSGLSWSSAGAVSINGSLLVASSVAVGALGGGITADKLSVATLSAISANLGTMTAGSITANMITSGTLAVGSLTVSGTISAANLSGGTLAGGFALGANNIAISSGGSISNADGDTWNSTGITLVSAGSFGDAIQWKVGGVAKGSIYASSSQLTMKYPSGGMVWLTATEAFILGDGSHYIYSSTTGNALYGSGTFVGLGDAAGAYSFAVKDSAAQVQFSVTSNGAFTSPDADATALGAYAGSLPWYVAGTLRHVPYYA